MFNLFGQNSHSQIGRSRQSRRQKSKALSSRSLERFRSQFEQLEERWLLSLVPPALHSFPSAPATLFLDFDGSPAFAWGGTTAHGAGSTSTAIPAFDIDGDAANFSATELADIQSIWTIVAEKFSPFNLDVTTVDPGNRTHGVTLTDIIGGSNSDWYGTGGGVSQVGSFTNAGLVNTVFDWTGDLPWSTNPTFSIDFAGGNTIPHEAGHAFGLVHERTPGAPGQPINEYYDGDATRSPIMGNSANGGNQNKRGIWWLTNMESGQQSPDPVQDELSIISNGTNAFGYRADDHTYASFVTLSPNAADPDGPIGPGTGVIENTADADPFKFTAHAYAGTFTISATLTARGGAMLSPSGRLIDAATLTPIASSLSVSGTTATLSTTAMVPGHDYFIEVDSAGNYGDIGQYSVSATFTDPPVVATGGQTISSVEGNSTGSVLLATFTDIGGPEALFNYSADINWGDGSGLQVGAGLISLIGTTFQVRGTHTYAEESAAEHAGSSPYQITITIHHLTSTPQSVTSTATVSERNVNATGDQALRPVEGADTGSVLVATFTDPGGPESIGDYSADIDWGDGTGTQVDAGVITLNGSTFEVRSNHTYAEESAADHPGSNDYQISVTIHHESSTAQTVVSTAHVTDPSVTPIGGFAFVATEGVPSAVQTVATFTDPGGAEPLGDYSALIDWGDGTAPSAGTITFATGVYTVQGGHTYAVGLGLPDDFGNTFCDGDPPTFHKPITVTITHESAPTSQATSDAAVSLAPGTAHLAGGNLIVVGTSADDHILINKVGNTGAVKVALNSNQLGAFTLGTGGRIIVAGLRGNDDIQVAGGIRLPTVLYGGPGNDRLKGGDGQNILVGCEGDDELIGGLSSDLLIGGNGADHLNGGAGNDILVSANIVNPITHAEDTTFSHLVAALNGGSIVVDDDGDVDVLTGAAGIDTFYYHYQGNLPLDIVTDKAEIAFNV